MGAFAAIWLIVLASTGLILQHSTDWELDKSYIKNRFILKYYGVGENIRIFKSLDNHLAIVDKNLIINNKAIISPDSVLKVAYYKTYWIIQSTDSQIWYNQNGEIFQSFDEFDHAPLTKDEINWLSSSDNNKLRQQVLALISKDYLSIEKVIFDIHAGITTSKLLNDFAAIALILLSISGFIIFFKKKHKIGLNHKKIKES